MTLAGLRKIRVRLGTSAAVAAAVVALAVLSSCVVVPAYGPGGYYRGYYGPSNYYRDRDDYYYRRY